MWIEIFKEGIQTDGSGFAHDGKALIDLAIKKFSAEGDTVPVVVGHPKTDSPAYGWVEKLKKEAGGLWAKLRDVNPDFLSALQNKTYPNRSAAFKDGKLRHIGFLGGAAPAVKGLKPAEFADQQFFEIEFSEPESEDKKADPEPDKKKDNKKEEKKDMGFTQEEMEKAQKKAAEDAEARVKAEFAEQAAKDELQKRKDSTSAWLENLSTGEGAVMAPAQKNEIAEFMESISDTGSFEFSEGSGKKKKHPVIWFQEFVDGMMKPAKGSFMEFAVKSRAAKTGETAEWDEITRDGLEMAGVDPKGGK